MPPDHESWALMMGSRDLPMIKLEARSPVGCSEEGLEGAGQVDEAVAHEEEHGEERRQVVDVAEEDAALADDHGEDERPRGLAARRRHGERRQERDDAVLGDGLQQPGRPRQRLQPRPQGGQERPDQDDPLVRPRDVGHHQLASDTLPKPTTQKSR